MPCGWRRGSTFSTVEEDNLQTGDKWFAQSIVQSARTEQSMWRLPMPGSHVDPRDNWDHGNGRIHRIRALGSQPWKPVNRCFHRQSLCILEGPVGPASCPPDPLEREELPPQSPKDTLVRTPK